ncbi:MAG: 16S rRNA processing protein RimM [Flavobacteriales bacterium]|nr:16S rRNA processing protein RimM [Flavobacteriales bacterium]
MNIEECFYLGYTSKVHGKQGELIAKLDVDNPNKYNKLESVLVRLNKNDNSLIPFFITQAQVLNNGTIKLKIDDINDVAQAELLVGKELFLPLNKLPKLTGNKFYYHEVIGFQVIDTVKGNIGEIFNVLDFPQQAVLEIKNAQEKEILIPITDQIIKTVDRAEKKITIEAPEGLIDIYLE